MADDFETKLEAYIDGMLPPHERAELERQLMTSPKHRRIVDQLIRTRHLIATLPRVQAPPDLLESIDPSVERAALFDEPFAGRRRLVSPQAMALAATVTLAATLITAIFLLVPSNEIVAVVDQPVPEEISGTPIAPDEGEQTPPGGTEPDDRVEPEPMRVADGNEATPVKPEQDSVPDGGRAPIDLPVAPALPAHLAEAMLISARVTDLPQISSKVFQFLTSAQVPIEAQQLPVSSLPEPIRKRLELPDDAIVQVFAVEELSFQEVGQLTTTLAGGGMASALAPASLVAEHRPVVEQPLEVEQSKNIYQEDLLEILIQRKDEPAANPPPGMPLLDNVTLIEVQVTSDGYADFGRIGLGRIDVLGRQPAEVAGLVSEELRRSYQIDSEIEVTIVSGGMLQAGRNREAVRLVYLDREPLKPGELVQIDLPDGAWLQAVVTQDGSIDAGEHGSVEAAGRSAAQVQQSLHELAVKRAAMKAERDGQGPLTTAMAPKPMRVVNLSARRAAGVDSVAEQKVSCLIVLAAESPAGPGALTPQPDVPADPAAPTVQGESEPPATPPQAPSAAKVLPPKRRPQ